MKISTCFYVLLCIPLLCFGQYVQLGSSISGLGAADDFGYSSSINDSGNVMISGSYSYDNFSGYAQVFDWNGISWIQRGEDIVADPEQWLAYEVSIDGSGNRVAVSAINGVNSASGFLSGLVRIYDWDGSNWIQIGETIEGEGGALGSDWFGAALSFNQDGNILAIGARNSNLNGGKSGMVRVFRWTGQDWVQLGDDLFGEETFDELGVDLSLNEAGNVLAIGAIGNGNSGFGTNFNGHVQVYEWDTNNWFKRGAELTGEESGDEFGHSVSLNGSGDILAVGAPGYDVVSGNLENTAYVYEWDGTDYIQRGSTLTGDEDADIFGWTISLNSEGNLLAIGGAPFLSPGHVWMYEWDEINYSQTQKLSGEASNDFFGSDVQFNALGDRISISAWGKDDIGHVYVFENTSLVSVMEQESSNVKCYPNPTLEFVNINATKNITSLKIYEISGKEVFQKNCNQSSIRLDLRYLNHGIYLLELNHENQTQVIKLLKH